MSMEQLIAILFFFLVKLNILEVERFKLDINPVVPIYWIDDESVMVNENERAFKYDVIEREIVEEWDKENNQIWGYSKDSLFLCSWYNKEIDSPEEYSTRLLKENNQGEELLDIELRPTVEVIECKEDIILQTVAPIEEKVFSFTDDLYEIEEYGLDILSPNFKRLITRDDLSSYWITKLMFTLPFP